VYWVALQLDPALISASQNAEFFRFSFQYTLYVKNYVGQAKRKAKKLNQAIKKMKRKINTRAW
jgi:hypothetical protein